MTKHCIFWVHGMGEQDANWADSSVEALSAAYKDLGLRREFGDYFDIQPMLYAGRFKSYWQAYADQKMALDAVKFNAGKVPGFVKAILKIAKKEPSDSKLLTYWADVALYAGTDYNDAVPTRLWADIVAKWKDLGKPNYSIIAHSLGTRVIHDTLQRAFSENQAYELIGQPTVVLLAANIARLMSFDTDEFTGHQYKIFPSHDEDAGACQYLMTARHEVDPIASLRPFKLHLGSLDPAFEPRSYYKIKLDWKDVMSKDVHGLPHYLAHPDVHVPLLNVLLEPDPQQDKPITAEMHVDALKVYRKKTKIGSIQADAEKLRDMIRAVDVSGSLKDQFELIKNIWNELQKMIGKMP